MVDRYWRKIESVEDNIENSMQICSILLKLKGYDEKLADLSKIDTSKSNISSILGKIDTNKNNISSNLGKIGDNKNNISSNLGKRNNNKSNIDEINENLSNIDFNSNNKYSIENFFIYNVEIENSYRIDKDKRSFSIFKYNFEDDFKKDSILEIDCRLLYQYTNYNNICLLQHIFKLYNSTDTMFYDYKSLKTNAGDYRRNDVKQNDVFYMRLDDDYDIIKIELILSLIEDVTNTVDCKIYNAYDSNFLCIKHYKKMNLISVNNNLGDLENTILSNSSKIDTNKNNMLANLVNINTNEDNIAYNLSEINYIKNNNSKPYLKNIYNILFYDLRTQVDFRNLFYEKYFDANANKNDFIEMNFKIDLQYEDISERNYVKTIYEIFDENDNSLYIKSTNNNKYSHFSNKVIIDENIFHNFTKNVKKIKFIIKFQIILSRVIKIWYIKNDSYRLLIKNYGL